MLLLFPSLFSRQFVCARVGSSWFLFPCLFLSEAFFGLFSFSRNFLLHFCFPFVPKHGNETTDPWKTNWNSGRVSVAIAAHRLTRRAPDQGHAGWSAWLDDLRSAARSVSWAEPVADPG